MTEFDRDGRIFNRPSTVSIPPTNLQSQCDDNSRGERAARWLIWGPLVIGGIVVVASQRLALLRWVHRVTGDGSGLTAAKARRLAGSLHGSDRDAVIRILGQPSSTVGGGGRGGVRGGVLEHWYYPVSGTEHIALAVAFENGRVINADVLRGPAGINAPFIR